MNSARKVSCGHRGGIHRGGCPPVSVRRTVPADRSPFPSPRRTPVPRAWRDLRGSRDERRPGSRSLRRVRRRGFPRSTARGASSAGATMGAAIAALRVPGPLRVVAAVAVSKAGRSPRSSPAYATVWRFSALMILRRAVPLSCFSGIRSSSTDLPGSWRSPYVIHDQPRVLAGGQGLQYCGRCVRPSTLDSRLQGLSGSGSDVP